MTALQPLSVEPRANRSPKVLIVALAWPPEPFLQQMVVALENAGACLVVCVAADPWQRVGKLGAETVVLPAWSIGGVRRAGKFAGLLIAHLARAPRATLRLLRGAGSNPSKGIADSLQTLYRLLPFAGLRPDIVHFQWNGAAIMYESLFDMFRCPTIISCRGSQVNTAPFSPRRPSMAADLRRTLGRATAVHCVSEAMVQAVRSFGVETEKTCIVRPGVDTTFFQPDAGRDDPDPNLLRIVMTGSLVWVKGHEFALIALRQLLDRGIKATLKIIGEGPSRQHVLFTVSDLGLRKVVTLAGRQGRGAVRTALRTADVFLLSSVSEGISNAALEAMACGLPVVTTACGGMVEAVAHGENGFVVPVRDSLAMCDALQRLAHDPELRRRMGFAARRTAVRDFDVRSQADQFCQLYGRLTESYAATAAAHCTQEARAS